MSSVSRVSVSSQWPATQGGGTKGSGASCANVVLTPEKEHHASILGDLSINLTPGREDREGKCENCGTAMKSNHKCDEAHKSQLDGTDDDLEKEERGTQTDYHLERDEKETQIVNFVVCCLYKDHPGNTYIQKEKYTKINQ